MPQFSIDRKALLVELSSSEPILKKEAEAIMRQQVFNPAVESLKESFKEHPVTQEIKGGIESPNLSNTLDAPFADPPERKDGREVTDYSPPNLTSFIGLEDGPKDIQAIEDRLDPKNADGPKMRYEGMDRDHLAFRFRVSAPDFEKIQEATPLPWAPGISWVKRIEQGIPGVGHFLNAIGRQGSRSGGGIQVEPQLRGGRFKPVSYLSKLFNDFLRKASSGRDPIV